LLDDKANYVKGGRKNRLAAECLGVISVLLAQAGGGKRDAGDCLNGNDYRKLKVRRYLI
jgi:hypothetical protein